MTLNSNQNNRLCLKTALAAAALLLILQGAALAISMRYAYIATDVLAAAEAGLLIGVMMVLSPLITYLRLAFLLWCAHSFGQKRSLGTLLVTALSLLAAAAVDVLLSAMNDIYFAGNEAFYILSAALSFTVGLCACLFLWVFAAEKGKKFAKNQNKKHSLFRVFLPAALTMYIIDALYRTYTVLSMIFSDEGLVFEGPTDVLYLVLDYALPLAEAALGLGFMCLCGLLFKKMFVKKA